MLLADLACAARRPSSVCVGGMRMSTTATSGLCIATWRSRSSAVAGLRDDLEAGVLEQPRDRPRAAAPSRRRARRARASPSCGTVPRSGGKSPRKPVGDRAGRCAPARAGPAGGGCRDRDVSTPVTSGRRGSEESSTWPPWPAAAMREARCTSSRCSPPRRACGTPVWRPIRTLTTAAAGQPWSRIRALAGERRSQRRLGLAEDAPKSSSPRASTSCAVDSVATASRSRRRDVGEDGAE